MKLKKLNSLAWVAGMALTFANLEARERVVPIGSPAEKLTFTAAAPCSWEGTRFIQHQGAMTTMRRCGHLTSSPFQTSRTRSIHLSSQFPEITIGTMAW